MNFRNVFVLIFAISTSASRKNYEGYKLYKVVPQNVDALNIVENVQNSAIGEIWNNQYNVNHDINIMVAPEKQAEFLSILKKANVEVSEVIADLQKAINNQLNPSHVRTSESLLSLGWNRYYNLTEVNNWLDELATAYPNIVSTVVIGQSVENRDIKGVIINFNPAKERPLIGMIEGTLHAREWITTATTTWIIKEFLTSNDPEIRGLAETFEWHIFPVTNPDGYEYTFTTNRMWRKNRSTASFKVCAEGVDNDMSNGVDLNRNFDFVWMSIGASNDSCTNTYAGPEPASEPETRAIVSYVSSLKNRGELMYYIGVHSFTQLIVVPYSHLSSGGAAGRPRNYADMFEVAIRSSDALAEKFGTVYRVGVSAEVMYPMSGTSFDWVKYAEEVPFSYLIELRDLGEYGFLLPADQIIPTGLETMDGFVEMDRAARDLGYYVRSAAASKVVSIGAIAFVLLLAVFNN